MANNVSSTNLTGLYGSNGNTVLVTVSNVPVVNNSVSSKNLTTLYSGSPTIVPSNSGGSGNGTANITILDEGNVITSNVASMNFVGNAVVATAIGNAVTITITGGNANFATNANFANFAGNVTNSAQPNITSLGTLVSLDVTGNITSGNANLGNLVIANFFSGNGSLLTGIISTGGNSNFANFAGNVTNSAQPNITSVGTLINLSVSGNITSGNANLGNLVIANYFSGDGSLLSNINGANVSNVANANYANFAGNVTNSAQPNITSVGTLTSLDVTGNISSGNANLGNLVIANFFSGDGSLLTNINGSNVSNVANANYANFAGNLINGTSNVNTNGSGGNISISVGGIANVVVVNSTTLIAGNLSVTSSNVTIGNSAGATNQGANSVAIGQSSAQTNQGDSSVAIGQTAGNSNQGIMAVAIGPQSGQISQGNYGVAIGSFANSGLYGISIGREAGASFQGNYGISIGREAGTYYQGEYGIAIGNRAGGQQQQLNSISIGRDAGKTGQGANSIAIGAFAGNGNQANNSIIFNATGVDLEQTTANTFTVKPVRSANTANVMFYDTTSGEITYDLSSNLVTANANYANFAGNVVNSAQPNITSLGNLIYLNIRDDSNAISVVSQYTPNTSVSVFPNFGQNSNTYISTTQYWPFQANGYPFQAIVRSRGNSTTPITVNAGDRVATYRYGIYNGNANVLIGGETWTQVSPNVNSNANQAFAGGQWNIFNGNPSGANLANSAALDNQNSLLFTNSGSLQITPGTPANTSLAQASSSLLITNYGTSTANLVQVGGLNFQRARGNRDSVTNVLAGDQVGRSVFIAYSNGAYQSSNVAQYRVIVDSTYVANDLIVPLSHQFQTVANVANVATFRNYTFNSNGVASFPGDITTTGSIISGNANLGNLVIANFFSGNGSLLTGIISTGGNANFANYAGNVTVSAQPNITSVGILTSLDVTGNISGGNANLGNLVIANFFSGDGSLLTNINGSNVSNVANANYAAYAGNVVNASQSNITSLGSLTGLTVSNATGVVNFTTTSNVTLGDVANLHISGGTATYVLSTNGSGNLSWVAQSGGGSNISNGTSNVDIATSGGNITMSVNGNANIFSVTNKTVILNSNSVFLGTFAGGLASGSYPANAIGIGYYAGAVNPNTGTIAIGDYAGLESGGIDSIAIGTRAGNFQGAGSVAVGAYAGGNTNGTNQGINAVAIGYGAGQSTQGNYSVAIGYRAGTVSQAKNSIVLNATGANLDQTTANTFTVKPIRPDITSNVLYYSNTTGEITYGTISVGTVASISNGTSNVDIATSGGNVTVGVGGTANVLTITTTGANITGYANITGNANVGNIGGNIGIFTTGNITTGNVANLFLTKFQETVASTVNTSTSISPNVAASTIFNFTANNNFTFNGLTSAVAGSSATVIITQDATGSRTMTSTMLFVGGSKTLSTAASAKDVVCVFYDGTTYFASLTKAYA